MANVAEKNAGEIQPDEKIIFAPLKDILIPYAWNVRSKADIERESGDGVRDGSREAGVGAHDFTRSFNDGGQDTPVILRLTNGKSLVTGQKTDKKYEIIAGFRRITAILTLNDPENVKVRKEGGEAAEKAGLGVNVQAVANVPDGHIKAVIREFADLRAARKLNARENTLRSNLQAPDLVRLCLEYANDYKATQVETSSELGITQTYVSKLLKVGSLPAPVVAHWRDGADLPGGNPPGAWRQLPINDMLELADFAKGQSVPDIIDRYKGMLYPSGDSDSSDTNKSNKVELELKATAFLLGQLVAEGILENGTLAWGAVMGPGKAGYLLNTGPKALDAKAKDTFTDLFTAEFERGVASKKR